MSELWAQNTFESFWGLSEGVHARLASLLEAWVSSVPWLRAGQIGGQWSDLVEYTLGEGRFGNKRWKLGASKRLYYLLRPFFPSGVRPWLRRAQRSRCLRRDVARWPVDDRYVRLVHNVCEALRRQDPSLQAEPFWPSGSRFALVLTHDVEGAKGQEFVHALADVEEGRGFRSSFNFVTEGYPVDDSLLKELPQRGFEIGVHGLKHDGKDFWSKRVFEERAKRINGYLREWDAVGFRAPFTHRNPEWMQLLDVEYDSSFFDADPYEPMPGGTMSIWPFFCGRFVELPYTLMQDHTLFEVFGNTPKPWLEKLDFIDKWGGMALVNTHPDYLREPAHLVVYRDFLETVADRMKQSGKEAELPHTAAVSSGERVATWSAEGIPRRGSAPYYWHALPRDVARWWRRRCLGPAGQPRVAPFEGGSPESERTEQLAD